MGWAGDAVSGNPRSNRATVKKIPSKDQRPPTYQTDNPRPPRKSALAKVRKAELVDVIIDERLSGLTLDRIGRAHGISEARVSQIITEHLAKTNERALYNGEQLLQVELARLNELIVAHWVNRKDPRHAQVILTFLERRHKLLGLDAAIKTDLTLRPAMTLLGSQLDLSKLNDEQLGWLEIIMQVAGPQDEDASIVAVQPKLLALDEAEPA